MPIRLKWDPIWLKSTKALQVFGKNYATMVVTVGSYEEAWVLLDRGIKFGGHYYRTGAYWDSNPESVCSCYCGIGHSGYRAC
jgi:hypothetical protein